MSLFKIRQQELKIVLTYSEVFLLNYLETILSIKLTLCGVELRI